MRLPLMLVVMNLWFGLMGNVAAASALPDEGQWHSHAQTLARYWLMPSAWGTPVGNFPTWRCNDGALYVGEPCPGLEQVPDWMAADIGRDYVRMQSRQTFAYGAIFNLTGDPLALALHEAGVRHLKKVARDTQGGFYSYFEQGRGGPARAERPTQDLAYALAGLAMHAYLTHDPDTLRVIEDSQRYIYATYWDASRGELRWMNADGAAGSAQAEELVAQLDQLNAYLLLTWRLLPPSRQARWTAVIRQTVDTLMTRYYDAQAQRFWGTRGNPDSQDPVVGRHNDWGHTVKGFWMLFMAARGLGDDALAQQALAGMAQTLARASRPGDETMPIGWRRNQDEPYVAWWEWAELDQAALTYSLAHADFIPQLEGTLDRWLNEITDTRYGELQADLKQHLWRNGYHSTEHALIGYVLSQSLRGEGATLYFAPAANALAAPYTPYLYAAAELQRTSRDRGDGRSVLQLRFAPAQWPSAINAGTR